MNTALLRRPTVRKALVWAGAVVGLLVVTQLVLPGTGGSGRGTPVAVLFQGLINGMLAALTAAGLVLVYRMSRIINFAQTVIGGAGGLLVVEMVRYNPGVPFPITLLLGIVLAVLVGVLLEVVFGRRFANAPRLVLTVITVAAAPAIATTVYSIVLRAPFLPPLAQRSYDDLTAAALQRRLPFAGLEFFVGSLHVPFGFPHLFALYMAAFALLLLAAFLKFTRYGTAIRAVAENSERAALLGISVGSLSLVVWGVAGALSGVQISLAGLMGNTSAVTGFNPVVFLLPLAAAVLGRMRALPTTIAAAVMLSVLTEALNREIHNAQALTDIALLVVVVVALLVQSRGGFRSESAATESWEATAEQRPIPKELRGVRGLQVARYLGIAVVVATVGLLPFLASVRIITLGETVALNTIAAVSLVVLTGWTGQVSLGQAGLMAVGAMTSASLVNSVGIPGGFWIAVPLATVLSGAFAALLGLPALRIRGLFLAVVTFAFAVAMYSAMAGPKYLGRFLTRQVARPRLFFLNFDDERSMYFLCVGALILSIVLVVNLRRTHTGRLLIALRENESNLQSFGVNVIRMKLLAFAISGGLAGFAGALYAFVLRSVTPGSFTPQVSFSLFVFTVMGGISSVVGALLGSLYANALTYFLGRNPLIQNLVPLMPLVLLYVSPAGLIALVTSVRDSFLRIIAQRRQIVVPSLFADYDPEALARRLIPLSESSGGFGLAALTGIRRFTLRSELYHGDGERIIAKLAPKRATNEAAAIAAAARTAE